MSNDILPLVYYGNPILRKKCEPIEKVTPEIKKLIQQMVVTMDENKGIGLAAPQIGQTIRLFILRFYGEGSKGEVTVTEPRVYINPHILEVSEETLLDTEGCLSIPNLHAEVERPAKIKVQAMNLEGETFTEEVLGYNARIVLHENDHINGVLFIDRIDKQLRTKLDPELRAIKKQYNP